LKSKRKEKSEYTLKLHDISVPIFQAQP